MKSPKSEQQTAIYKKIQNYIFKFSNLLGQGNFSKVYSGTNELTNEIVAIKIVELQSLKSKKLEELLFSEIDVLKKLNHPNVLKCFDVFTSNRNCYIITELCNEGDLESKLRKQHSFAETRAQSYIRDIFEGLLYLNENQVIHRDIKVANIFIHNGKAKIADFGFAKFIGDKFKDMSIGSPLYMSPQGFVNNIYGPKTDVWAFGVLVFQLLHGFTPYSSCKTQHELRQSLSIPIAKSQIRGEISHELKDVILACMQVDESKRISVPQLKTMPYFQKKQYNTFLLQQNVRSFGQVSEQRIRPPSYNAQERMPKTYANTTKPESSIQGFYSNQGRKESDGSAFVSAFMPQSNKSKIQSYLPDKLESKDRRAISSERTLPQQYQRSIGKQYKNVQQTKNQSKVLQILSGTLAFKQCVSILHYGRLIFKFLLTLKVSSYSNNNQLFKLTRWLMDLLNQMNEKIQRREVTFQGENSELRQRKLKQVREEYAKKYCADLENYIQAQEQYRQNGVGLDHMISFTYKIYQKYDAMIDSQSSTPLLVIGHCVLFIYHTTKLIKDCYDSKSYIMFANYKEIETFLGLKKEQVTWESYLSFQKKMMAF